MLYLCTLSNSANNTKFHVLKQETPDSQSTGSMLHHLKPLGSRSVTCSKAHAEDPKMIGNTLFSLGLVFSKWLGIDWAVFGRSREGMTAG